MLSTDWAAYRRVKPHSLQRRLSDRSEMIIECSSASHLRICEWESLVKRRCSISERKESKLIAEGIINSSNATPQPDSCIGSVEMIAPVAHRDCVATQSGVVSWRVGELASWRVGDLAILVVGTFPPDGPPYILTLGPTHDY